MKFNFPSLFRKKDKYTEYVSEAKVIHTSYYADSFKQLKKNKAAMFCLAFIVILCFIAIFAPLIAPYNPDAVSLEDAMAPMGKKYFLGADEYGRDILSRIFYGTRISLAVGLISQLVSTTIGVSVGAIAGYYGGKVDTILSRIIEIFASFPDLIFAIGVMFVLGPSVFNLFIAIGMVSWTGTARMIRGQVLQCKEREYVKACIAAGGSDGRIIMRHILPNCLSQIIIIVTMGIPGAIMSEAGLSFIGLGVQPPMASWGSMINAAQSYMRFNPSYSISPGIAIILTVLAFNIFGDGLRDALDPRLKNN